MIQVRLPRFHYNSQKKEGAYPSYRAVREEFGKYFETFRRSCPMKGWVRTSPNQWGIGLCRLHSSW